MQEAKIHDEVKRKFDLEIKYLKAEFQEEKENQEKILRDMHDEDMCAMRKKLENDFEHQKVILTDSFNEKLLEEQRTMQVSKIHLLLFNTSVF